MPRVTQRDVQLVRPARARNRHLTVAQRSQHVCIVDFVGCDKEAFRLQWRRVRLARVTHAESGGLQEERSRTTLVRRAVHAGVELHDPPVEARDRAQVARGGVSNDQSRHPELLQQRLQHVGFRCLVAQRSAAIPVGAVLGEQRIVGGRLETLHRVGQRTTACRPRRAAVVTPRGAPSPAGPGVGIIAGLQQLACSSRSARPR